MSTRFVACMAFALSVVLVAYPSNADESGSSGASGGTSASALPTDGALDAFYGSSRESIPLSVPNYHGIEPNLSLSYGSQSGNGTVGVGWRLRGVSTIERVGAGKVAPTYGAKDVFLLDGDEIAKSRHRVRGRPFRPDVFQSVSRTRGYDAVVGVEDS